MTQPPRPTKSGLARRLPLILIVMAAVFGLVALRDQLGFAALAAHRDGLLAYRDAHYVLAVLGFLLTYIAIVTLSLPGATAVEDDQSGFRLDPRSIQL